MRNILLHQTYTQTHPTYLSVFLSSHVLYLLFFGRHKLLFTVLHSQNNNPWICFLCWFRINVIVNRNDTWQHVEVISRGTKIKQWGKYNNLCVKLVVSSIHHHFKNYHSDSTIVFYEMLLNCKTGIDKALRLFLLSNY